MYLFPFPFPFLSLFLLDFPHAALTAKSMIIPGLPAQPNVAIPIATATNTTHRNKE